LSRSDALQSRRALLARPAALLEAPRSLAGTGLSAGLGTTFSRRRLLQAGGVGAAVLSVPGLWRLQRSVFAGGVPEYLRRETYVPLVGSSFAVAGSRQDLKLVAVNRLKHSADGFSLLFRARRGAAPLDPVVRGLRHPALGSVDLVLLPVGRAVHGQSYQSIIDSDRHVARKEVGRHGQ
jgi:hypothetical protein